MKKKIFKIWNPFCYDDIAWYNLEFNRFKKIDKDHKPYTIIIIKGHNNGRHNEESN